MPEPQQILVRPLSRRLFCHDCGDGLNPIEIVIHSVVGKGHNECPHRRVEDFILKGSGLSSDCQPCGFCSALKQKVEKVSEETIVTFGEFFQCCSDTFCVGVSLLIRPRVSRDGPKSEGYWKFTEE